MTRSWENKKQTSRLICENEILVALDETLKYDSRVLSHKLCGAGNGGYFLIFSKKDSELEYDKCIKIGISETGLKYGDLKNEFTKI